MKKSIILFLMAILICSCVHRWTKEQEAKFMIDCKTKIPWRGFVEGENIDIEKSCSCTMKEFERKYSSPPDIFLGYVSTELCFIRTRPVNRGTVPRNNQTDK